MQLLPYILCLVATGGISWVYVGIVYSRAARRGIGDSLIQLYAALLGAVIYLTVFLTGKPLPLDMPARTLPVVAITMMFFGAFNFCMIKAMTRAMSKGPNGVIWSITQSGMVFPFLMGVFFFGVELSATMVAGVFLIFTSIVLFGIGKGRGDSSSSTSAKSWFWFALLAFLFCGLNQCAGNIASYIPRGQEVPSAFRAMCANLGTIPAWLPFAAIGSLTANHPGNRPSHHLTSLAYAASLLAVSIPANILLFYRGLDGVQRLGYGSIGFPVCVCSCIFGFFIYSAFILKERQGPVQILGGISALVGVIVICL